MTGFFKWFFLITDKEKQSYVGIVALASFLILLSVCFAPWHKGESHHEVWLVTSAFLSGYWLCRFLRWEA